MSPLRAIPVWLAAAPALAGWFGAASIPEVDGMAPVLAGRVVINRTAARYVISSGSPSAPGAALDRAAREAGWRPAEAGRRLAVPAGKLELRSYRSGDRWLVQGIVRGVPAGTAARESDGAAVAVQAVFDGMPVWANAEGEAPGDEPAGWPRPASARRLLHLAGRGFEAACYATPASPAWILSEAARRLRAAGWRTEPLGSAGLSASSPGRPDSALWTRPEGKGCVFVVIATEEVR